MSKEVLNNNMDNRETPDTEREAATKQPKRRRPLKLPFDDRRRDSSLWVYDHRIGLCVMIIAYLVIGIAFVSTKITTGNRSTIQGFEIDLQALDELERERDRLEALSKIKTNDIDWSAIKNTASNENALNENLQDDRGTNTSALNESAEQTEKRMRKNREAYERGLAEADAIGKNRDKDSRDDGKNNDRKVKGSVTVSFSFTDPVRYSRKLIKPAYRCEGGGEVVVDVAIDRNGKVVSAQVCRGGDECMRRTAVDAARGSVFDINGNAPARQTGTITYIFIPQ